DIEIFDEGAAKILAHREDPVRPLVDLALERKPLVDPSGREPLRGIRGLQPLREIAVVMREALRASLAETRHVEHCPQNEKVMLEVFGTKPSGYGASQVFAVRPAHIVVVPPDAAIGVHVPQLQEQLIDPRDLDPECAMQTPAIAQASKHLV